MRFNKGDIITCHTSGYWHSRRNDKDTFCTKGKRYKVEHIRVGKRFHHDNDIGRVVEEVVILDDTNEYHGFYSHEVEGGSCTWFKSGRRLLLEKGKRYLKDD